LKRGIPLPTDLLDDWALSYVIFNEAEGDIAGDILRCPWSACEAQFLHPISLLAHIRICCHFEFGQYPCLDKYIFRHLRIFLSQWESLSPEGQGLLNRWSQSPADYYYKDPNKQFPKKSSASGSQH
jgi:hypothetical protein